MKARVGGLVGGLVLTGGVLAGIWVLAFGGGSSPSAPARGPVPKTYAQLAASNYKVLSSKQSLRLLRFADAFVSCMAKKGVHLGRPEPGATKIVMALPPGLSVLDIGKQFVGCGDALGGPPKGASLVQPRSGKVIELYLPKRCLLDRKVVEGRTRR
jgi:hypothetical protein